MTYENPQYPQLSSKAMEVCGIGVTFCGFWAAGIQEQTVGYIPDM